MNTYSEEPLSPEEQQINEHFRKFPIVKLLLEKLQNFTIYISGLAEDKELLKTIGFADLSLDTVKEKITKFNAVSHERPIMAVQMLSGLLAFYDEKTKEFDIAKFRAAYPVITQSLVMLHSQQNPSSPELKFPDLDVIPEDTLKRIFKYASFFCSVTHDIVNAGANKAKK